MNNQLEKRTITTGNNYVAAPDPVQKQGFKTTTIAVRNVSGANPGTYKIEGSADGENWFDVIEAADLAKEKTAKHSITDYWPFLRCNAKSKEEGKAAKLEFAVASVAG